MARSESDRWDLATSVGATATMVAAERALASDAKFIDDPYAAPLVRAVGIDVYVRVVNGEIPVGGGAEFDPHRMAQGMACRTRFYDNFFLDATRSGIGQAVILASGLDARAYRLPWPAGTVVYEVDMPEVIEFKTLTLGDLGAEPTAERRTVAVDLRDDWAGALQAAGFDPKSRSGVERRGAAGLPARRSSGCAIRQHHRVECAREPTGLLFVPDTAVFADPRWRAHHERMSELGFEVDFNDLVYHGQRSHIIDYLKQRAWQVSPHTTADLHAANGFTYPDDDVAKAFADVTYSSAVLAG